jgi:hypothetical protein
LILGTLLIACGSDDKGTGGTGGNSSGGSAGSSTGGTAGASTGGTAGSSTGGTAGSSTGGPAGAAPAGVTCDEICIQVGPFQCSKGATASDCVEFCEDTLEDGEPACKAAWEAVLSCESVGSDMSCDDEGYVTTTECATEWTALQPCWPPV